MENERKKSNPGTLTGIAQTMLQAKYPLTDDPWNALQQMGFDVTCGAVMIFGLIQKASKGDANCAKFLKELNGEGTEAEIMENGFTSMTDEELLKYINSDDLKCI